MYTATGGPPNRSTNFRTLRVVSRLSHIAHQTSHTALKQHAEHYAKVEMENNIVYVSASNVLCASFSVSTRCRQPCLSLW